MTMEQYLSHVRSQFYRAQVDGMRRETDPTRRGMLKKKLFWILPQGGIKPGHRQVLGTQPTKEDIEYRDLQMLDLDTLPEGCATPADAWYHMRHRLHDQGLAHYPMVVMESASGGGLHIYVRLSERMTRMNRREVIALWGDILGVEFDPAVTDPARRAFQSHRLYCPDEEVALLFGAELTDKQREAMEQTPTNLPLYGEALQTSQGTIQANTLEALPIEGELSEGLRGLLRPSPSGSCSTSVAPPHHPRAHATRLSTRLPDRWPTSKASPSRRSSRPSVHLPSSDCPRRRHAAVYAVP